MKTKLAVSELSFANLSEEFKIKYLPVLHFYMYFKFLPKKFKIFNWPL